MIEDNLTIGLSKGPSESNPQICMIENMQNRTKFLKKIVNFQDWTRFFLKFPLSIKNLSFKNTWDKCHHIQQIADAKRFLLLQP